MTCKESQLRGSRRLWRAVRGGHAGPSESSAASFWDPWKVSGTWVTLKLHALLGFSLRVSLSGPGYLWALSLSPFQHGASPGGRAGRHLPTNHLGPARPDTCPCPAPRGGWRSGVRLRPTFLPSLCPRATQALCWDSMYSPNRAPLECSVFWGPGVLQTLELV